MVERLRKDVVVIGSGGAGLTCAYIAARAGLNVLLVEKEDRLGGTLSWSGGGLWFPLTYAGEAAGFEDSREDVLAYLDSIGEGTFDRELIETYVDSAPELAELLRRDANIEMIAYPGMGDWFPDASGARAEGGRSLTPLSVDGRELGKDFARLRLPLQVFNAPGGMMVDIPDIPHLMSAGKSLKATLYAARLAAGYLADRVRYGRGARLTMGNALAARLLKVGLDAGVEMWTDSPARGLLQEGKRITGAIVQHDGREVEIEASRGVLLASGGFSANKEMRRKYIPFGDQHHTLMSDSNAGDGIAMGRKAGAEFVEKGFQHGGWVMLSLVPKEDGSVTKFPHLINDRPKPGFIAVNAKGERFCNEASLDPISSMHESGSVPAWLICDEPALKAYGMGPVQKGGWGLKKHVGSGYITKASTLAELAGELGIDPDGLVRTVARHNEFARTGKDLDFGRGDSPSDRSFGDPEHGPNPNLGEIGDGPYYAIRVYSGDSATMLGLRVDREARVLDEQGEVIEGLYAAGLDMVSIFRGRSPGGGANNGPAMVFGYLAAESMARGLNDKPQQGNF